MNILCFDISTGGMSAAVFDDNLNASQFSEEAWDVSSETRRQRGPGFGPLQANLR